MSDEATAAHQINPIEIGSIDDEADVWPRRELDQERVATFVTLYADGGLEALPPLEVVPDGEGEYLLSGRPSPARGHARARP